ncbi:MAG TPA: hypothetical protein VK469_07585 [Candidatus Kapabacteria bacterium]|nr:hypothetical protein [Candidatus Kapabacteria bacterium]
MTSKIHYEYAKIFTRNSIIVFLIIVIVSLYFTFQGATESNIFSEYKSDFLAAEKDKFALYFNYEQYGAAGFRVILEPALLSVFFNRYDFTRDIEARIDTSEIISLYNERKGKKAFSTDSRFGDLNQSLTIFGTLIMMIMGFLSFPNQFHIEYFKNGHYVVKTILVRILLLNIFFVFLLALNYAFARILGITFRPDDNMCFIWYGLSAILLLDISFLSGLLIKAICKYRRNAFQVLMISWFIFIFLVPEIGKVYRSMKTSLLPSEEKLDIVKLRTLLDSEFNIKQSISNYLSKHNINSKEEYQEFQKLLKKLFKDYINNGYALNQKKEADFLQKVKQDIDIFSFLNTLYPVDFLNYTSAEVSGKGYNAYIDFFQYIIKLRDRFMQFYGQKRPETAADVKPVGVESFIRNSENIYQAKSRLPENFGLGMVFMFSYLAILLGFSCYRNLGKKITTETFEISGNFKPGQILFLLVNKKKQAEIANALKQGKRPILHRASHLVMNKEVTAQLFINYACREKKIKRYKVIENLELLGIQEKDLHKKIAKHTDECKRKLICALVFAEENDVIIINDFIKGASYEFEQQFLNLVAREAGMDRKIIYLGSEIYTPSSSLIKSDIKVKTYQPFYLAPQKVSLR